MSGIDPQYAADVIAWAVVWSGVGLAGRQLIAKHELRQAARRGPKR
jgi:hypothetical protein